MMKTAVTLAVAFCVSGLSLAQNATRPTLETITCPNGVTATSCAYLIVPENRAAPQKTIKLFTALVRSSAAKKASEPLFFLTGGPGEKAGAYTVLAQLFPDHDLVVFDQRGVGLSQPALECPEFAAAANDSSSGPAQGDAAVKTFADCGARLKAQGVDLSAYNATESAADVNDLRLALGYDKVLLFGVSYGTRLAQEVMRSYPQGLRAVVLDSVIPPQIDRPAETPRSFEESLQKVFKACAADVSCNDRYPNLERVLNDVTAKRTAQPVKFTLGGVENNLDGNAVLSLVIASLYFAPGIAELPKIIYALSTENYEALRGTFAEQFGQAIGEGITWGAFFSHECRGEMAYSSVANLRAAYALFPRWAAAVGSGPSISSERGFAVCQAWGLTTPSGHENDPVSSDVPTLLMAGEFDPVTPSRYLALASAGLTHAITVEMKAQSHSVSLSNLCGYGIASAFLTDPSAKLDTSCAASGTIAFK